MRLWKHDDAEGAQPDPDAERRKLEKMREETARIQSETQKWATLGRDLRRIRVDNHLAEAFTSAARRATDG